MTINDTGIDASNLIDTIVQCKLKKSSLKWKDFSTFFGSQNMYDQIEKKTIVRWPKMIIAHNSDSNLSPTFKRKTKIFEDIPYDKKDILLYCDVLLMKFSDPRYANFEIIHNIKSKSESKSESESETETEIESQSESYTNSKTNLDMSLDTGSKTINDNNKISKMRLYIKKRRLRKTMARINADFGIVSNTDCNVDSDIDTDIDSNSDIDDWLEERQKIKTKNKFDSPIVVESI